MILFASRQIVVRQKRRLPGFRAYGLGAGCTLLAAGTVTMFTLLTELHPEPWYHPRYALPLLGMILGNTHWDKLRAGRADERALARASRCRSLPCTRGYPVSGDAAGSTGRATKR